MNNVFRSVVVLVILFSTSGCYMFNATDNPFQPTPPDQTGPIAQMRIRCIDAGDVWEEDRLQCRQVAPWKKIR